MKLIDIIASIKKLLRLNKKSTRQRDNCPAWVKEESLEKAKQKRKMRADKLRKQFK